MNNGWCIALASASAVSGGTYLALKPSTQMNEVETKGVNKEEASSKTDSLIQFIES
ncbi:MAG: hypothetical protein ACR5K2_00695 [Wolbachia sp.]